MRVEARQSAASARLDHDKFRSLKGQFGAFPLRCVGVEEFWLRQRKSRLAVSAVRGGVPYPWS
jgi:hypothetical protein